MNPNPFEQMSWFDVHNLEHLRAYRELQRTGIWPKGFLQPHMILPHLWDMIIRSKLADVYLEEKLVAFGE